MTGGGAGRDLRRRVDLARRALWHLRHGGPAAVVEFNRRRRAIAPAGRIVPAGGGPAGIAPWPVPDPRQVGARHDVTVGVIADEFTARSLAYEWRSVPLSPVRWREQVDDEPIDLLFVESAWHGNDDAWRYAVLGAGAPSPRLRELVAGLRARGVPTVFWNKEDPAHFEEAIGTARLFDWVFTTDEALVERYRTELGHDRVGVLPFAAQPLIHNPVRVLGEDGEPVERRGTAFAGTYFAHKYPERREQMDLLLGAALDVEPHCPQGLDIFSRFLGQGRDYQFPPPYDARVRGSLSYDQMLTAYRLYTLFLNVNSVVDSPSMIARRVIEITACNTPVLTAASAATGRILGPHALAVAQDREQAGLLIRALSANPDLRDRMAYLAQRDIWARHTYSHRVGTVLEALGMSDRLRRPPTVAPIVSTNRPHRLGALLETLASQRLVEMRPVILTHGFEPDPRQLARARDLGLEVDWLHAPAGSSLGANYNLMLERVEADFVAKMDDDDLYADHYLFESLAAADYSRADLVGKHAHFVHLEDHDLTVLRFSRWEHRYTSFVSGPTIVMRTDLARAVRFPAVARGEDTGVLRRVAQAGGRIYSASRYGFVQRRGAGGDHTWDVEAAEILASAVVSHWGPPDGTEMPEPAPHPDPSERVPTAR